MDVIKTRQKASLETNVKLKPKGILQQQETHLQGLIDVKPSRIKENVD